MKPKKIYFDDMKNWIWITILILSFIFILVGTFEFFEFESPKLNKGLRIVGFFLQVIYFGRMFWYKNYFQWNKKGAIIRMNSWIEKSLRFNQIEKIELIEKKLIITKVDGSQITFNLNEIEESDTLKLNEIIVKNTIVKNV